MGIIIMKAKILNAAKIYVNMYGGDSASNSIGSGSGSGSNDSANTHCNSRFRFAHICPQKVYYCIIPISS